MHEGTLYLRPSLLLSALALSLFSSSSSWCSELYLAPPIHPSTTQNRRCPPAGQSHDGPKAEQEQLPSFRQPARKKKQQKQSSRPTKGTGGDRPDTHRCTAMDTHIATTHTHTKKGHRGRCYNYADDIHLMMTFPQTQTREIIR